MRGRTFPLGTPRAFPVKNRIQAELRRKQMRDNYARKRSSTGEQALKLGPRRKLTSTGGRKP